MRLEGLEPVNLYGEIKLDVFGQMAAGERAGQRGRESCTAEACSDCSRGRAFRPGKEPPQNTWGFALG